MLHLHLPDLSGREVLQRLQADPTTRTIPVIIASADAPPAAISPNPLDVSEFLATLDSALSAHLRTDDRSRLA